MQKGIKINDSMYPKLLKEIVNPPKQIYYKGNWDAAIFENCLAVVGSRRMTNYGMQITTKLVSEAANAGITIVSGFMYGVDATAHKAALAVGGKTIAVMPCGIKMIHPQHQESLYNEILDNKGLVISEFEGDFPPAIWTYPKRNRIVAGLSKATMVVEAGKKSGSLITASLARNYKRKLFVVPGPLTSINSEGIIQLIKEGANIVTSTEDILETYDRGKLIVLNNSSGLPDVCGLEKVILENLQREPMSIDELSRCTKVTASKMSTAISLIQLKGLVLKEGEKFYLKFFKSG